MRNETDHRHIQYWIVSAIALGFCLSMVVWPTLTITSAQKGIDLWARVVLPALLPFFICANFMVRIGIPNRIGSIFEKSFQTIFGAPGSSAFVFTVSVTSGYPMGPTLIGDMARNGLISTLEAEQMLTFCSTSGPLFLLGSIGVGLLHSPQAGMVIALAHYFGAIANGLFYRLLHGKTNKVVQFHKSTPLKYHESDDISEYHKTMLDLLTDSFLSAMKTLGIICCYLIVFMILIDGLEKAGLFTILPSLVHVGFLKGIFEMTVGSDAIVRAGGISMRAMCVLLAFLVSFGGLSTFGQSVSVLNGSGIRVIRFLIAKITHGIWAAVIAYFVFPYAFHKATTTVGAFGEMEWFDQAGILGQLLFSTKMIIMVLFLLLITIAIDHWFNRRNRRSS